jgi:hypothetical protein
VEHIVSIFMVEQPEQDTSVKASESTAFLEKPMGPQLGNKFTTFYGTWFITVSITTHH